MGSTLLASGFQKAMTEKQLRPSATIEPFDVVQAYYRHRGRVILFVAFVALLTGLAIAFLPKVYVSESKLFVRIGRESVGLDPTATTGKTMSIQTDREVEVQSVLELLGSRALKGLVIDEIGAERLLEDPDPNWLTGLLDKAGSWKNRVVVSLFGEGDLSADEKRREAAYSLLEKNVRVWAKKNSTVISISARARSPHLAQEIAATVVDCYQAEHARIHRTAGSEVFFEEQTARVARELDEAEAELRDTKNRNSLVSIEGHLALLEAQKADIEQARLEAGRELAEAESAVSVLRASLEATPETVLAEREERPSEAADAMREQLHTLEMREQELLSKFRPDYPLVRAVSAQLAEVRKIQDRVDKFRSEPTYSANPNRQKIELDFVEANTRLASLRALDESLDEQYAAIVGRLEAFNDQSIHIESLERQSKQLSESYEAYLANLEQARIDRALQREQITNVNVAQPATIKYRPDSPRPVVLLALGILISAAGSFGIVVGSERLNRRLRSAEEVEAGLSLPVIMTLPRRTRRVAGEAVLVD